MDESLDSSNNDLMIKHKPQKKKKNRKLLITFKNIFMAEYLIAYSC